MSSNFKAIYKNLLKSINITFKGVCVGLTPVLHNSAHSFTGDNQAIRQSKLVIRDKFYSLPHLDASQQQSQLNQLSEVSDILRKNIVQAELQDNNNFNLHFTPYTELGDNSTISQPPSLDKIKKSIK